MIKVEKITEKVELLDVEVQKGLPDYCKHDFVNKGWRGTYNCLYDCDDKTKMESDAY